jgi:hypothetical protein
MKTHVQVVAALHIAMGAFALLAAIAVFGFLGMASGIVMVKGNHEAAGIVGIVAVALGGLLAVLALPSMVGGWALLTGRSWGRPVVLVLGALQLLHIPLGTALGVYTFWALLQQPEPPTSPPTTIQLA